jgi:hypothetical protein
LNVHQLKNAIILITSKRLIMALNFLSWFSGDRKIEPKDDDFPTTVDKNGCVVIGYLTYDQVIKNGLEDLPEVLPEEFVQKVRHARDEQINRIREQVADALDLTDIPKTSLKNPPVPSEEALKQKPRRQLPPTPSKKLQVLPLTNEALNIVQPTKATSDEKASF